MDTKDVGAVLLPQGREFFIISKALWCAIEHLQSQEDSPESDIQEMQTLLDEKFSLFKKLKEAEPEISKLNEEARKRNQKLSN